MDRVRLKNQRCQYLTSSLFAGNRASAAGDETGLAMVGR